MTLPAHRCGALGLDDEACVRHALPCVPWPCSRVPVLTDSDLDASVYMDWHRCNRGAMADCAEMMSSDVMQGVATIKLGLHAGPGRSRAYPSEQRAVVTDAQTQ